MRNTLLILVSILLFSACGSNSKKEEKFTILKGETMGSFYEIAYDSSINIEEKIAYTLGYYNYLLSTYDSNSIISKFNNNRSLSSKDSVSYENSKGYFIALDSVSKRIHKESMGAFNPGLASLMNYWGFGEHKKNPEAANQFIIDSLKRLDFGFLVQFKNKQIVKLDSRQALNFNAIAAGQAVDIIAEIFDSVYKFKNYYINISGEVRCKGNNGKDSYWPIKIEKPMFNSPKAIEYCRIPLKNYSLATSGNYRQFFFSNGKRYSHSIDPRTGYPSRNEILSATILAPTAAEADAYATACMVLGLSEAQKLLKSKPGLKAFLIYGENNHLMHWASDNLSFELAKNQ